MEELILLMEAKTSFVTLRNNAKIMLISVKMGQSISFFFYQKMRNWYLGNYKKEGEKSLRVLTQKTKQKQKQPVMHLSV